MSKKKVAVKNLVPGMRLAEKITNSSGITVIPSGVRLTPLFINRLTKWGLESVDVVVDDTTVTDKSSALKHGTTTNIAINTKTGSSAALQEFAKDITVEVTNRFKNLADDELMMRLRSIVLKKLIADGPNGKLNRLRTGSFSGGSDDQW